MKTILLFVLFAVPSFAQIPPVIPNTYVQDHANVLTPEDEANIQNQLNQLKIKYNLEFAVATVTTTEPRVIADYSLEMARTYGIGAKDGEKRGILLLLAIKDRKWRFEISRHMEAMLTDSQSGSIGRNVLVPAMKKAKDSTGYRDAVLLTLNATEEQILKRIEPEQKSDAVSIGSQQSDGSGALAILGGIAGLGVLGGGGYGLYAWRRRRREEEEERLAQELRDEEERLARIKREKEEEKRRKEREIQLEKERVAREAHERWLKTPAGIAHLKEQERLAREAEERRRQRMLEEQREQARREREHQAWLLTPEGKEDTARRAKAKAEREAREKRAREEEAKREKERAKRRREDDEREERRRRESSYSSSSSSSSSYDSGSSYSSGSSWSSGSLSSSSGFGGGGDFGGGGSSGDW